MSLELSSSEEGGSVVGISADDHVLRDVCTFFHITGAKPDLLKDFVRFDGTPLVPGVDWDCVTSYTKKAWKQFIKSLWRNTKASVERRQKYPESDSNKHANSLPHDFNIFHLLRPRSSLGHHRLSYLPKWTEDHYYSQFRSSNVPMADLDADAVKRSCFSYIGTAELVGSGCVVEGKPVDFHVAARFDRDGHLFFACGGAHFMGSTVHHGALVDPDIADSTVDAVMFSVLNPDTSCPNAHVAKPFSFGQEGNKIFTSIKVSAAIYAIYAQHRHDLLSNRNDVRQVMFDSQQELLTKIKNLPDREISICVEFPKKFRLVPGLLQRDAELVHHFPEGIDTKTSLVQGTTVEQLTSTSHPFAVAGVDMLLGVGGLHHLEKKDNAEDYLKKRMDRLTISGMCYALIYSIHRIYAHLTQSISHHYFFRLPPRCEWVFVFFIAESHESFHQRCFC